MNPEIFTLCTAGTVRYKDIVSGGVPDLTAADICAGLAAVKHNGAERLLLLKYAGFEHERARLKRILLVHLSDWCRTRELPRPGLLTDMALLAIHEIADPQVCGSCQGRAYHRNKVCPVCEGSGTSRRPNYRKKLGISKAQWVSWRWVYGRLICTLVEWESQGVNAIYNALCADDAGC